ncbi:MAG: tRNA lysidine(34) synthetase TilS [Oscillospiraceae bacterium]|nr:tRNA lysidine(34) synthetase TilS [Oscillospiraceae bacterium]
MSLPEDFQRFIEKHRLAECDVIVVAVSGGPDSMCLLDLLVNRRDNASSPASGNLRERPTIVAAHLNHGLRGIEADRDEAMVREYCREHEVPFFSRRVDIAEKARAEGRGLEEAGREARYAFFDEVANTYAKEGRIVRIAVAHRREDQAETMLINLFRGAGPDGLCSMEPIRGRVIRPLLFADKARVDDYVSGHDVPYAIDRSNSENEYTRNKWRNVVLPMIREVSARDPVDALLSFGELLGSDREYLDMLVSGIFEKEKTIVTTGIYGLPTPLLRDLHPSLSSRLIRMLFEESTGGKTDLTKDLTRRITELSSRGKGGCSLSLPGGYHARIHDGTLYFERRDLPSSHDGGTDNSAEGPALEAVTLFGREYLVLKEEVKPVFHLRPEMIGQTVEVVSEEHGTRLFSVGLKIIENPNQVVYNNRTWYCPVRELSRVTMRAAEPKDSVRPAGSTGSKALRRYLTDRKVPVGIRKRLLVAVDRDSILWVPGLVHAEGFTDEISYGRYTATGGFEKLIGDKNTQIVKVTVLITDNERRVYGLCSRTSPDF